VKKILNLILANTRLKGDIPSIREIEKRLNYNFKKPDILIAAITHTSLAPADEEVSVFERMEFLGDAILGLVVSEELFIRYPFYNEGQLSKLKAKIVSRKYLAMIARQFDLGEYIFLSEEASSSGGKTSISILANTMESIICAIYLDGGIKDARTFITQCIMKDYLSLVTKDPLVNFKSTLQEHLQGQSHQLPQYRIVEEHGPDHHKEFVVGVFLDDQCLGTGTGPNKKAAQQAAAKAACESLQLL